MISTVAKRKRWLSAALVCATVAVAWAALPYHPIYQEWLCRESSLEKLQALQTQLPENPVLLYYLGRRFQEAHRGDAAVNALERAVALDIDTPRLRNALAEAQMSVGRNREAYKVVRQFYETHPENPEAFLMMARFYLTTQTFAPAAAVLKDATKKFPDNAECWALRAIAQLRMSDTSGAEKAVAEAVHLRPQESKYWFLQAQILKQSRKSGARAAFEQALQRSPNDLAVQAEFADYLARAADYNAAEKWARKVLRYKPDDLRASGALGLALAQRNDPAASPLLIKGLQNDGQDVLMIRTLHRLAVREGKTADAKRWMKQALLVQNTLQEEADLNTKIEKNPDDAAALRGMAALMGRNGDYFRCMQYQARALRQVADASAPLLAAARDLEAGGFPQLARRLAEQSLQNSKTQQEHDAAENYLRRFR